MHNRSARNKELILLIAPFERRERLSDFFGGRGRRAVWQEPVNPASDSRAHFLVVGKMGSSN